MLLLLCAFLLLSAWVLLPRWLVRGMSLLEARGVLVREPVAMFIFRWEALSARFVESLPSLPGTLWRVLRDLLDWLRAGLGGGLWPFLQRLLLVGLVCAVVIWLLTLALDFLVGRAQL